MDLQPTFPAVIDSSMRSAFVACHRQGYYAHMLHLRRPEPSIHLHFGKCVAAGLETARKSYWGAAGRSAVDAIADACGRVIREWGDFEIPEPIASSRAGIKSLDAALDAIVSYFERFPLGNDSIRPLIVGGEPCVEMSFALPIPGVFHPVTDEPLLYCGRFDMIGTYNGAVFIVDEKTTSQLGAMWRSNWTLRGQLTGYTWGARSFGVEAQGCIIRGLGIMKGSIEFEEAIVSRPQWHVEAWLRQLQSDLRHLIAAWRDMTELCDDKPHLAYGQAFDSACSSYGGCGYLDLCDTSDPRRFYDDFIVSPWNPLHSGEVSP